MDLVSIYFAEATCPCDLVEMARLYAENASLCKIVILSRFVAVRLANPKSITISDGRNLTNCRNDCTAPKAYITSELTVNKTVRCTIIAGTWVAFFQECQQ